MVDHENIIESEFALMPVWKIIPDPRSFRLSKNLSERGYNGDYK